MTQALSQPPLRLQLTPMQLLEAEPTSREPLTSPHEALAKRWQIETEPLQGLLVNPGAGSEMVVKLKNVGTRSLQIHLQVEGNFAPEWCRIGMEGNELGPGQQMDAVLYFQLPADYFEQQHTLSPGESLTLNYQVRLYAYYEELGTQQQQVETQYFNLCVRPHSLYLDFLPAIYREVDFVGRLLKIFEQSFEPTVQTLDMLWAYLNPLTAPEALLPFLAHWVAFPLEPRWSSDRQRHLIHQAMELYRWRGTKRGLRLYLHLYTNLPLDDDISEETEKHICIQELFSQGFRVGSTRVGRESLLGGGRPHHFIVRLRPELPGQVNETLIRTILDREKPAFSTYDLYIAPPS